MNLSSRRSAIERGIGSAMLPFVAAYATTASSPIRRASAAITAELPDDAYTTIGGDMKSCKILNGKSVSQCVLPSFVCVFAIYLICIMCVYAGMWQLSGGHGYRPKTDAAVDAMRTYADAGK